MMNCLLARRLRKRKRALRGLNGLLCVGMLISGIPAPAQVILPLTVQEGRPEKLVSLSFRDAPLEVVLDHYAELTGRTIIQSPGVPPVFVNLRNQQKFSETKSLVAIESILAMHNIALVPLGEEFLKVIPIAELRTHGMEINQQRPGRDEPETDKMETRIFELDHLAMTDIQPVLDGLKHSYGKIQPLERVNGFMITDTATNLKRIEDIVSFLDKALETKVETRIYELRHSTAAEVASRLNELIQQSQQREETQPRTRLPVVRPRTPGQPPGIPGQPQPGTAEQDLAERGIVQGDVRIVADERTNILIVISRPSNFTFFDKIVAVLDRAVEPEVAVEVVVVALEYAAAEDIAAILNDFVGAATQEQEEEPGAAQPVTDDQAPGRSTALQEFVRRRLEAVRSRSTAQRVEADAGAENDVGRLSSGTRILADQRTNSLLLMGRREDIAILKGVIDDLDVMLAQVLIEAVILEVNLSDSLESGIDWLQRSLTVYNDERLGPGGGLTVSDPVLAFGGGQRLSASQDFIDSSQVDREVGDTGLNVGGLTYYATFFDLNLDAVISAAAASSDASILSTPVVATTDNTEARIVVGESRPVVTSTSTTSGGVGRNTFQYQDIGITLNVTPRINPKNFVVMEITQTADNVGGFEVIDGNNVPIITRREMEAQIAVQSHETIVLGGLISSDNLESEAKVPILGDIPILGNLFRTVRTSKNRTELLVLITPYVMANPGEVYAETKRLRNRSFTDSETWQGTWSDSPLVLNEEARAEGKQLNRPDTRPRGILSAFQSGAPVEDSRVLQAVETPVEFASPESELDRPVGWVLLDSGPAPAPEKEETLLRSELPPAEVVEEPEPRTAPEAAWPDPVETLPEVSVQEPRARIEPRDGIPVRSQPGEVDSAHDVLAELDRMLEGRVEPAPREPVQMLPDEAPPIGDEAPAIVELEEAPEGISRVILAVPEVEPKPADPMDAAEQAEAEPDDDEALMKVDFYSTEEEKAREKKVVVTPMLGLYVPEPKALLAPDAQPTGPAGQDRRLSIGPFRFPVEQRTDPAAGR